MKNVKISIITATWNCIDTLPDCLLSIASQTYNNFEHIVIDGGSTDGTASFLKTQSKCFSKLISEPDKGIYEALNKGIAHATGDVIGFLHADDIFADKNTLELISNEFLDSRISGVYGDLQYVRKDDLNRLVRRWKSSPYDCKMLTRGWMPAHPTVYIRREWYSSIGNFDENYRISADYLSVLKLFSNVNFRSKYIPRVLVKMRVGGASNRSFRNIVMKSLEDYRALRSENIGGLKTLIFKNFRKLNQFF